MNISEKFLVVAATREKTQQDFYSNTLLGKSVQLQTYFDIDLHVFLDNKKGLCHCYNLAIDTLKENEPKTVIFVHDDVAIFDYYWPLRVHEALKEFDIVGIAGNARHEVNYPNWAFKGSENNKLIWDDDEFVAGSVLHGDGWPAKIFSYFGDYSKKVVNLDGLFLATTSKLLLEKNLRFDELFDFHFYDADFCKSATEKSCSLGTFPLSILHQLKEGNHFNSPEYYNAYVKFVEKWSKNELRNN